MNSRKEMTGLLYALVRTEVPHFAWQPISLNGFLCLLKSKEKVPAPLLEWYPTWEPRVQCVRFAVKINGTCKHRLRFSVQAVAGTGAILQRQSYPQM